jgi:hypothetical protein
LAAALFTLALAACSGVQVPLMGQVPAGDSAKLRDQHKNEPSPEEDPKAPGQIPQECEALLNHAMEWGHTPVLSKWQPKNREEAIAATEFFSTFHLVPESTSVFAAAWMKEARPTTPGAAKKSVDRMDRAQSCDMILAHDLLVALIRFGWGKSDHEIAGRNLLAFVKAQQQRVEPSMARAIELEVLARAAKKNLLRIKRTEVAALQTWYDAETRKGLARADVAEDPMEQWKIAQDELRISEDARKRIDRVLP